MLGRLRRLLRLGAAYGESCPAARNRDVERRLDLAQVLVERAAEPRETLVVDGVEPYFYGFSTHSDGFAAQRMGPRLCNPQVHEAMHELGSPGEVDYAVVAGACAQLGLVSLRKILDQNPLRGADHAFADAARLRAELRLETLQPRKLFFMRGVIGQLGSGGSRPRAVQERKRAIETDLGRELQRGGEIRLGLAGKADDEIRGQAQAGARALQAARNRAVLERGVAALHRGKHAVRAG